MRIEDISFKYDADPAKREVLVTLDNGTVVHIGSCYESWQQWGGTTDELYATVDVADIMNGWLHDPDAEIPVGVYSLIDSNWDD